MDTINTFVSVSAMPEMEEANGVNFDSRQRPEHHCITIRLSVVHAGKRAHAIKGNRFPKTFQLPYTSHVIIVYSEPTAQLLAVEWEEHRLQQLDVATNES